jgi:hypothetical protein
MSLLSHALFWVHLNIPIGQFSFSQLPGGRDLPVKNFAILRKLSILRDLGSLKVLAFGYF